MRQLMSTAAVAALASTPALAAEGGNFLLNTNLWVLLGFLIVIGILVKQNVGQVVVAAIFKRTMTIASQLNEARTLREDAQKLLADYQKRQRDAEAEAEGIIAQAKADAKAMAAEAKVKMEEQVARRTEAAQDRIARAEAQALAEVRAQTADLAIDAASGIIQARTDASAQKGLLDRAITDIRGKLN